jgi:hypothetical protein
VDQQDRGGVPEAGETHRWVTRPWAATFDLISAAYGWTDGQILDLTLSRIWQVREVLIERLGEEREQTNARATAVTRQLVLHIRLAAGDRKAAKAANAVKLFEDPEDSTAGRGQREMNTELAPVFAERLGGGGQLEGLTPELIAAAYG